MNASDKGTLYAWNRHDQTWVRLRASLKRDDPAGGRCQVRVDEWLPYPAAWDCRRLLGLGRVWFEHENGVTAGKPAGAAGRNLTLEGVVLDATVPMEARSA